MFKTKKLAKKRKQHQRRIEGAEEDGGDDDENDNTTEAPQQKQDGSSSRKASVREQIQYTKKKRKLWTDLQYKRGVNTQQLMRLPSSLSSGHHQTTEEDAVATTAVSSMSTAPSKEKVIEQKHEQAMETYIQTKLAVNRDNNGDGKNKTKEENKQPNQHQRNSTTKEQLYEELAATAQALSGRASSSTDDNKNSSEQQQQDGDTGAGGQLVAGTGIAEVVLPIEERWASAVKTETAVAMRKRQGRRGPNYKKESNGGVAGAAKLPTSTVGGSRFKASFFHQQQERDREQAAVATTIVDDAKTQSSEQPTVATADEERLGFDEIRRLRQEQQNNPYQQKQRLGTSTARASGHERQQGSNFHQQSSESRMYKRFVSRELGPR